MLAQERPNENAMQRTLIALVCLGAVQAATLQSNAGENVGENPIRRIVSLLQNMQTEVTEEGERDKDLNEKFLCYCEKNDGELSASTEELRNKIPELEADIESAVSLKAQLDADLVKHKDDRVKAKESIESATKQREKEAAEFADASSELTGNINSCKAAISALTKGLGGSFLQTPAATTLRNLVLKRAGSMERYTRDTLTEFLSVDSGSKYTPVSQEIIGILSQLQEDMEKELADITKVENDAITQYEGLVSAKEKEIAAATAAIESKTERAGETAVQIVSLKNDLEDTKDELGADEVFLMELKKSCATKGKEYEERVAARAQELVAISETIKILNDDDALDLFKKTLDSPSLLQFSNRNRDLRKEALLALRKIPKGSTDLSLITLMLHGKKAGFEKVLKLIDQLVVELGKEQEDDDAQLKWCNAEFDSSEDTEKDLKRRIAGLETKITESEEGIASLIDELAALKTGIKELDEAVDEATTQRKDEHKEFVKTAAENSAALQLLEVARNRMNKFYNPALYKAPKQRELTEEEQIYVNSGGADPRIAEAEAAGPPGGIAGTGVTVFTQMRARDTPPPPPETGEAYANKDASGPVALIDKLSRDLEKDVASAERDEADAQKEYERFMSDSVMKRTTDSKSITEKEAQKAELEADLMGAKDIKGSKTSELMATQEYIVQLHGSCDFLVKNYDLRKKARADEVDALKRAKAVLSGADYSFRQVQDKVRFLARPK
jgi:chromosome segregation ATPase